MKIVGGRVIVNFEESLAFEKRLMFHQSYLSRFWHFIQEEMKLPETERIQFALF